MSLTRLLIRDFRNIESADLALSLALTSWLARTAAAKPACWKPSIRSATVGRFAVCRLVASFATSRNLCSARAFAGAERETAIGLTKDKQGDSKVRIDGTDGHKVAELALLMPMQLITPEGFTLLNGGPKYRRAFLDWGCFHNEAGFFNAWSNLKRLLKQRNAALRQVTRYAQLRPWDMELIPLAEQISRWRAEYSAGIAEDMADTCKQFLPEFSLTFSFQRGWEKETDYAEVLERNFERDRMLTYTAHGPHKADFRIRADGAPVEDTCRAGSSSS
jgi:DNA replication and repair protein RecF